MFPDRQQFARQSRISKLVRIQAGDAYRHPVFHLEHADIVQERSPTFELFEILSHTMGKKDVPNVAAIHDPLRRVDAASSYVRAFVYVHHTTDRSTVNAHPHLQTPIVLERAANLHRTLS